MPLISWQQLEAGLRGQGTTKEIIAAIQHIVELTKKDILKAGWIRELNASDSRPVLTLDQNGTGSNLLLTHATTPIFEMIEEDQTDPAGRYRFSGESGSFTLYKAKTASWATSDTILQVNASNSYVTLVSPDTNNWYLRLAGGLSYTKNAWINIGTITAAGANGIEMRTGDGTSSNVARFQIGTGATTVDITWAAAVHSGFVWKSTSYTSSGAITTNGAALLNKTTPALAMTLANPDVTGKLLIICQIDTGTAGHTVTTASTGGFDGTNNTATFNAQYDSLVLYSIGVTRWIIVENLGVVLSAV